MSAKENKTQILVEVFKLKFNELMQKFGDKRELEYQCKNEDNLDDPFIRIPKLCVSFLIVLIFLAKSIIFGISIRFSTTLFISSYLFVGTLTVRTRDVSLNFFSFPFYYKNFIIKILSKKS